MRGQMKKKDGNFAVFSLVYTTSPRVLLAVLVLDELVEAIPSIVIIFSLKVVVECLDNSLNAWVYRMADDIRYAFGRFFNIFKIERFIITVQQISLGEVLEAVGRE